MKTNNIIKLGILGCCGKVGRELVKEVYYNNPEMLAGCLENPSSSKIGMDLGEAVGLSHIGVSISADIMELYNKVDVLIDFTNSSSSLSYIKAASEFNKPIVVGTTGFNDEQEEQIKQYAKKIAIVKSSNMSLGVNVLFKLLEVASTLLKEEDYDIEILEKHHKHKIDAPSGTAITLGNIIAASRDSDLSSLYHPSRKGITKGRQQGKIGFSSIRGGDLKGEHSVMFLGNGEVIELKHTSTSRLIFIKGAIRAASWVVGKPAGLYNLQDVLNIQT